MKGFDRPLKPIWIYNFIQILNVGDKFSDHKESLDSFLEELNGVEGKRKVRTVLTRYFLKSESNPNSNLVEHTPIMDICKIYKLEKIKPLLLFFLLMRSNLLRTITKLIVDIFGYDKMIKYDFLRKKIIEKFGEKDISSRSLSNFFNTLVNFNIIEKKSRNEYIWNEKLPIDDLNVIYMLKFYSEEYKKSPKINLDDLENYLFVYFQMPNLIEVVRKYNSILWEFSSGLGQQFLLFNKDYLWNEETLENALNKK